MTDLMIEAHKLTKSFRGHQALSGLDLCVPKGSIYGFLGRNGAGKTTTIKTPIPTSRSFPRSWAYSGRIRAASKCLVDPFRMRMGLSRVEGALAS